MFKQSTLFLIIWEQWLSAVSVHKNSRMSSTLVLLAVCSEHDNYLFVSWKWEYIYFYNWDYLSSTQFHKIILWHCLPNKVVNICKCYTSNTGLLSRHYKASFNLYIWMEVCLTWTQLNVRFITFRTHLKNPLRIVKNKLVYDVLCIWGNISYWNGCLRVYEFYNN
jgi:hypothetical protein